MAQLEESEKLCREALHALVEGPLPEKVAIADRKVELRGDRTEDEISITATWEGGELGFRFRPRFGHLERSLAEDRGHSLGLQAFDERGQRELSWISFEWAFRDSIRQDKDAVPLLAHNSYRLRKVDVEASRNVRHMGPASRAMAERSGLDSAPTIELGKWSRAERRWLPSAGSALEALCKLVIIKAHFVDRGTGTTIQGSPLFSWEAAVKGEPSVPAIRAERLSGVPRMVGALKDHWENLLDTLAFVQDASPSEADLFAWFVDRHKVVERRAYAIIRLLLHTDLLRRRDDRLELSDAGAGLLEGREPSGLFDALRASYTGFEESLVFFARHPGARAPALRAYLNTVLDTKWEADLQARLRAEWLATCGLLVVNAGRFTPTEQGLALAGALDAPSEPPEVEEAPEEAYDHPDQVQLKAEQVNVKDLVLPPGIVERCCAAIAAKKHLLLIGPPGTGKSTLAVRLAAAATEAGICEEALTATASADWTTYDTIGGWTQRADGSLAFREGVVTRALRERRWLVLDEVNRADIDKSFGELFTALAGGRVTTPYTRRVGDAEVPVDIGPDSTPYQIGPWFRLIATMNIRDKASLFRLSYAFLRRFAVIVVPALDEEGLAHLGAKLAAELTLADSVRDLALRTLSPKTGLGKFAPLGPSLLIDILRYAQARGGNPERAVAEAVGMIVVPQLENLTEGPARAADELLDSLFGGDPEALRELRSQFRSNFPDVFDFGG